MTILIGSQTLSYKLRVSRHLTVTLTNGKHGKRDQGQRLRWQDYLESWMIRYIRVVIHSKTETNFHLLQVATTDRNASFLVDQFEDDRDGRKAFKALEKWFEGMKLQNKTAEDIRSKLDKNLLTTKVTATRCIN